MGGKSFDRAAKFTANATAMGAGAKTVTGTRRKPAIGVSVIDRQLETINPKVAALLSQGKWHDERKKLREILLDSHLAEEVKWGKLCYTFQERNVALIYGLKDHCALGFLKGALLRDAKGILVAPGNNSQAARWVKVASVQEIAEMEPVLRAYVQEAIEVERAGLRIDFKEKRELVFPEEFQNRLEALPALKIAFAALTPGRQRAYNLYFSAPKRSQTRVSRIEKYVQKILDGKGFNDR